MNPFIFQFKEQIKGEASDYSMIAYNPGLNLSINIKTGEPAITYLDLSTETDTKTSNIEGTDSDRNAIRLLMGTETVTLDNVEGTDSDRDRLSLKMLLGTQTETRTLMEQSDSD